MPADLDTSDSSSSSGTPECSDRRRKPNQALRQQPRECTPEHELPENLQVSSPHLAKLLLGVQPPRRTRRKVQANEYDEKGNRRSPAEMRRVKRRITNRESAKYMREIRQQDMHAVRKEVIALLSRTAELQKLLLKAHDLQTELQQHSSSWQQLWSAAMASNIKLSSQLAAQERMVASTPDDSKMDQSDLSPFTMLGMAAPCVPVSTGLGSLRTGSMQLESITPFGPDMHTRMHGAEPHFLSTPDADLGFVHGLDQSGRYSTTSPLLGASFGDQLQPPPAISPILSGLSQARASLESKATGMLLQAGCLPLV